MAPASVPMIDPQEDAELMLRVQRGDEAAFGMLMQRWELSVKSVIGRIVLNVRDAEELAQETFVRVWQQRGKYDASAPFRPWIFTLAVNLARNRLRWWRSRPEVALEEWSENAADATSGATAAERKEGAAAVRTAIAALPPDMRETILLSEYEQMPHAEIAVVVRASPKAIENRVARAREKLRGVLARWT